MPCWYYEKKDLRNTPSIRDGLEFETERRYRREGTRFIMECGKDMILGHNTIATAGYVLRDFLILILNFHSLADAFTGIQPHIIMPIRDTMMHMTLE